MQFDPQIRMLKETESEANYEPSAFNLKWRIVTFYLRWELFSKWAVLEEWCPIN